MRGTATLDGVRLEIIGLRQVTEPVPARRRKKAASSARKQASGKPAPCAGSSAQRSEDSSESSAESSDSDGQQMCALEEDVRGSSGGSSCPSVDTDAESGLDDLIDEVGASDLDDAHEAQDEEGDEAGPGGPLHQRGPRHPSGTWVIWQNTWFYIAKTPPYQDVKCHVRHAFRTLDGLGLREMSKTLTPAHYGETWDELVRTILLLRSWAAWRVRQNGFWASRLGRVREAQRDAERLFSDLREALHEQGGVAFPFLGNEKAHRLLRQWVPDIVQRLALVS